MLIVVLVLMVIVVVAVTVITVHLEVGRDKGRDGEVHKVQCDLGDLGHEVGGTRVAKCVLRGRTGCMGRQSLGGIWLSTRHMASSDLP